MIAYDNIRRITLVKEVIIQLFLLLDYSYFKKYYKMLTTDLSKQQPLDANPKSMQQIKFTGNLDRLATMFFIIEEQGFVRVL